MCHRTVQYLKKGDPGPQGRVGRLPVPYGAYGVQYTVYTCTDVIAPYVLFDGQYYVMNKNVTWYSATNPNPKVDYQNNGANATWIYMEKYKAIFVEMLLADFGKIASAIFYGNLMFSQQGKKNNVASSSYEDLHLDSNGNPREQATDFVPNFWINFLTGKLSAIDAVIKGVIEATSGSFANGEFTNANMKTGSIAGFEFSQSWLRAIADHYGIQISPATINLYANNYDISDGTVTTNFEAHPYPSVYSYFYILFRLTSEMAINASDYYSYLHTNILMYLKATGAKRAYYSGGSPRGGNFAAWCEGGMFAGMRLHTRHISSSETLQNTDNRIIVNNSSEITLTLPRYPEVGQEYEIWHTSGSTLNIQSYNATTRRYIYRMTKTRDYAYSFASGEQEIIKVTYAHNIYHNAQAEDGLWLLVFFGKHT